MEGGRGTEELVLGALAGRVAAVARVSPSEARRRSGPLAAALARRGVRLGAAELGALTTADVLARRFSAPLRDSGRGDGEEKGSCGRGLLEARGRGFLVGFAGWDAGSGDPVLLDDMGVLAMCVAAPASGAALACCDGALMVAWGWRLVRWDDDVYIEVSDFGRVGLADAADGHGKHRTLGFGPATCVCVGAETSVDAPWHDSDDPAMKAAELMASSKDVTTVDAIGSQPKVRRLHLVGRVSGVTRIVRGQGSSFFFVEVASCCSDVSPAFTGFGSEPLVLNVLFAGEAMMKFHHLLAVGSIYLMTNLKPTTLNKGKLSEKVVLNAQSASVKHGRKRPGSLCAVLAPAWKPTEAMDKLQSGAERLATGGARHTREPNYGLVSYTGSVTQARESESIVLDGDNQLRFWVSHVPGRRIPLGCRAGAHVTVHHAHAMTVSGRLLGLGCCLRTRIEVNQFAADGCLEAPLRCGTPSGVRRLSYRYSIVDAIWMYHCAATLTGLDTVYKGSSSETPPPLVELVSAFSKSIDMSPTPGRDVYRESHSHDLGCAISRRSSTRLPKVVTIRDLLAAARRSMRRKSRDASEKSWTHTVYEASSMFKSFDDVAVIGFVDVCPTTGIKQIKDATGAVPLCESSRGSCTVPKGASSQNWSPSLMDIRDCSGGCFAISDISVLCERNADGLESLCLDWDLCQVDLLWRPESEFNHFSASEGIDKYSVVAIGPMMVRPHRATSGVPSWHVQCRVDCVDARGHEVSLFFGGQPFRSGGTACSDSATPGGLAGLADLHPMSTLRVRAGALELQEREQQSTRALVGASSGIQWRRAASGDLHGIGVRQLHSTVSERCMYDVVGLLCTKESSRNQSSASAPIAMPAGAMHSKDKLFIRLMDLASADTVDVYLGAARQVLPIGMLVGSTVHISRVAWHRAANGRLYGKSTATSRAFVLDRSGVKKWIDTAASATEGRAFEAVPSIRLFSLESLPSHDTSLMRCQADVQTVQSFSFKWVCSECRKDLQAIGDIGTVAKPSAATTMLCPSRCSSSAEWVVAAQVVLGDGTAQVRAFAEGACAERVLRLSHADRRQWKELAAKLGCYVWRRALMRNSAGDASDDDTLDAYGSWMKAAGTAASRIADPSSGRACRRIELVGRPFMFARDRRAPAGREESFAVAATMPKTTVISIQGNDVDTRVRTSRFLQIQWVQEQQTQAVAMAMYNELSAQPSSASRE